MSEDREKPASVFVKYFIGWGIAFAIAYFVNPTPDKHYEGFIDGVILANFHGTLWFPNWVMSLFEPSHLVKASSSSTVYTVFWWLACVGSVLNMIKGVLKLGAVLVLARTNQ